MTKPKNVKPKKTREEKLAQARIQKRKNYEELKKDPEKYAIQKEKERQRYLKRKEQNKLKSINDMTPRHQRLQRKRWRENRKRYRENRKKERVVEQMLLDNSPPSSDIIEDPLQPKSPTNNETDPLEGPSRQPENDKKEAKHMHQEKGKCVNCFKKDRFLRQYRYMSYKKIGLLKAEIEKLKKEKKAAQKNTERALKLNQKLREKIPSTEQKVEHLIENIDSGKKDEVKRKLLFGEVLTKQLKEGFKTLSKKDKRHFSDVIVKDKSKFKKHKILTEIIPFTVQTKKSANQINNDTTNDIKQNIEAFFEDDSNTIIAADKKEYIKRNSITKQKRYLSDTLTNLHKKFIATQNLEVGYSTFCKYRPFWVVYPKESDRNTCACVMHVNMDLLIKALNKSKIIKESNGSNLLESLCCDIRREECLNRSCRACNQKVIDYAEFRNDKEIKYYQWGHKIEKYTVKNEEKSTKKTTKTKMEDLPLTLIKKLDDTLPRYFKHCLNIVQQYKNISDLKHSLAPREVVIHMDFSENYITKFHEEVQSRHFGSSPEQISLHTSVAYLLDPETGLYKTYSMCTMSDCTRHDAEAVWAHIIPIIEYIQSISAIDTVHFVTDSPSSQYRNKKIFYIMSQLQQMFPNLKAITWNYLESGHGKGAPDGIGAVIKRTADSSVRCGKDIGSLEDFWAIMKEKVKSVEMSIVTKKDIEDKKTPEKLSPFKGTMSVHQVLWSATSLRMTFRKLSCFFCPNGDECNHGYHLGYMDVPKETISNKQERLLQDFVDENTTPELIEQLTNSPKQTYFENLDTDKATTNNVSQRITHSPKVKILSDIRLDWSNTSFYGKHISHNKTSYQTDFEKFISTPKPLIEIESNSFTEPVKGTITKEDSTIKIKEIEELNKENSADQESDDDLDIF